MSLTEMRDLKEAADYWQDKAKAYEARIAKLEVCLNDRDDRIARLKATQCDCGAKS